MKYALLFSVLFFTNFTTCFARTITSFSDSNAILTIAQFMIDNAEEMNASTRISDKKLRINDTSNCTIVTSTEVLSVIHTSIQNILRLYPDEELPLEEAFNDLADYMGDEILKKCVFTKSSDQTKVHSIYFFDSSGKVHVKVDTITLLTH